MSCVRDATLLDQGVDAALQVGDGNGAAGLRTCSWRIHDVLHPGDLGGLDRTLDRTGRAPVQSQHSAHSPLAKSFEYWAEPITLDRCGGVFPLGSVATRKPGRDRCHVSALEPGHAEFLLAGHPLALAAGNSRRAVGAASLDLVEPHLPLLAVG